MTRLAKLSRLSGVPLREGNIKPLVLSPKCSRSISASGAINMALSLAYAGSRGLNLLSSWPANPPVPQVLPGGQFFWLGNEPRPNPNWTTISQDTSAADSWYNSLQWLVRKQLSKGLQFQSSFTWSKLIDDKPGFTTLDNGGSGTIGTQLLPHSFNKGPSDYTVGRSWRFNAIYHLPELTALHGFAGTLLNGWWTSGILTLQDGLPFTVTEQSNRSRSQDAGNIPDVALGRSNRSATSGQSAGCQGVPSGTLLGTPSLYYDPCAFAIQPAGFMGDEGRNILTDPGIFSLDFSLVKDTALRFLGEAGKLEFRSEFFNILNRPNFGPPNAVVYAALGAVEAPLQAAGHINTTTSSSRQIQFALKVIW